MVYNELNVPNMILCDEPFNVVGYDLSGESEDKVLSTSLDF